MGSPIILVQGAPKKTNTVAAALRGVGHTVAVVDPVEAVRAAWEENPSLVILDLADPLVDANTLYDVLLESPEAPAILGLHAADAPAPDDLPPELALTERSSLAVLAAVRTLLHDEIAQASIAPGFANVLAQLWQEGMSGVLHLSAREITTVIYFKHGQPIFAERGTLGDTLGKVLLRHGKITEEQFASAIHRMTDSLVANEQIRFGEVLVELGHMTPDEVYGALGLQARDKLLQCFQWERVEYTVEVGEEYLADVEAFPCNVPALIYDGLGMHYSQERLEHVLGEHTAHPVVLAGDTARVLGHLPTGVALKRFINEFKNPKELAPLLSAAEPLALDAICALVTCLLCEVMAYAGTDSIPTKAEPNNDSSDDKHTDEAVAPKVVVPDVVIPDVIVPPVATKSRDTAKSRAGTKDSTASDKDAEQKRRPTPSAEEQEARRKALARLRRRTKSRKPAGDGEGGKDGSGMAPKTAALAAESSCLKGKRLRQQSAAKGALQAFEHAAKLQPEVLEYQMLVTFMRFVLSAEDNPERQTHRDHANALAKRVLSQDSRVASAHNVIGNILKLSGNNKGALRAFDSALKLDSDDIDSARESRLLRSRMK